MEYKEYEDGFCVDGCSNWELVKFGFLLGNEGIQCSFICLDGIPICVYGKFECVAFDRNRVQRYAPKHAN